MPTTPSTSEHNGDLAFVRRVFIVVAIGALIAVIWALSDILLLLFGAILFAVMLHAVAAPLETNLRLGRRPALALGGALMVLILAAAGTFLGPELVTQMRNLFTTLPEATNRVMGYFQLGSMADLIKDGTTASALGGLATRIIAWSTTIAGALASLLLVLFGGIYLAINPRLYRDGLVKLVPPAVQPNVNATLDDSGEALKRWLAGQVMPCFWSVCLRALAFGLPAFRQRSHLVSLPAWPSLCRSSVPYSRRSRPS